MYRYILAFVCVCTVLVAGCKNSETAENVIDISYDGDVIVVKESSPVMKEIVIQKSELKDFSAEFKTVGTVRPVSGKLAEITPPFAGRIIKSFVQLGQKVSSGAPVFELSSSDFYEATKTYFAAQSANELAQRNYNRQKELVANGVGAQRDLEQAQSEAHIAIQEYEQAKAILQIFNIDLKSLQMGHPLKVTSPISGEIVKYNITIGSYAKEDSEPLAVVADLSKVWVAALVKEQYFGLIERGDRVEVYTNTNRDKAIQGTIYHVGRILDEETRSLEVIIECDNSDNGLKPGMFCDVHFFSTPEKAIILPSTSVMQEEVSDYILIEVGKGRYERRNVKTESIDLERVRITDGLKEGENIVVRGGIFINI